MSGSWPATASRATPRSSRGRGDRRPHRTAIAGGDRRADREPARRARPRRVSTPGPKTIVWHLAAPPRRHGVGRDDPTAAARRRAHHPEPKKRPKASYIRFEADLPNECWQSDFTHWRLADGTDTEILTWLDDHARYALSVTAHRRVTGTVVVDTFLEAAGQQGYPASILTDNALVYTTRFAGGRGGRNHLETTLAEPRHHPEALPPEPPHHLREGRTVPADPQALARRPTPRRHLADLQALLDNFVEIYNHHRPHSSLDRRTPAVAYRLLPKAGPRGHRRRHPPPRPPRPHRQDRRHLACAAPAACTTSASAAPTPARTVLDAHRRPRHPRHRHHHRRAPPPPHPRPHPRLPTPPQMTRTEPAPGVRALPMSRDITMVAGAGFEPTTFGL